MESIKLDLIPGKKMPSLNASQYDKGRDYHIDLTENRVPYTLDGTETISLTVRKCDNTLVTMDIANTFADKSYIEFRTTEQMNACAGFNYGEITIEKNGTQISSLNFYLQVEGAPDEGGIQSQSEINNLARQVHDIVAEELEDNGASETGYNNSESGLEATNVQDAIDELASATPEDVYTKEESDEKFATKTALEEVSGNIPTKTSDLQNDSGFAQINDSSTASNKAWSAEKINNELSTKVSKNNPTMTGYFSLNRKSGTTTGDYSDTLGYNNTASGNESHAEGINTTAINDCAHSEGNGTTASGKHSHAEGATTTASGNNSHSEGSGTTASGVDSHAEGYSSTASGDYSHSEGYSSTASGDYSHSEGLRTVANHKSQHVFGENNIADDSTASAGARGKYVEIVGNGTSSNDKSNARTLDWSGNEKLAGDLIFNGNTSLTTALNNIESIFRTSTFIALTKQYTPGIITSSGYVNQTSASNGFSVSTATPINDLTKITIPYDFVPSDESYIVVGFYTGTTLGSFISGVAGTRSQGFTVDVPTGANYYRISCPDNKPFGILKVVERELVDKAQFDNVTDRLYGKGYYLVKGNMSSGDVFEIPQTNCKNNQVYSFTAKSDNFSGLNLVIGHGKTVNASCYITITPTNCNFTTYGSSAITETHTHGLTLSQFIDVKIIVGKHGVAKISIQTADTGSTYEYVLDVSTWTGCSGDNDNELYTFAECVTGALTDCVFSWSCSDFRKQLWVFGDSYFNYESTRPMYYLEADGFYDNILVNAYGGENSQKAVVALTNMLQYFGKPKYILWCMGQNDGSDTTESSYTTWLSYLTQVLNLCKDNDITPILCTIPSVPKGGGRSHELKNAYIRSSDYRYVDMAKAVGAEWNNGSVTWYPSMLASDNEHPDVEGGKAIEKRMLMECPELTFSN